MTPRVASLASLLDEAMSGLWRARRMTIASILQITLSLFLVGVFFLAAENLRSVVETVRAETAVTIFLKPGVTQAEREGLEQLARSSRLFASVRGISAGEARRRFAASWKALAAAAASLPGNPFPEVLELEVLPSAVSSDALPEFLKLVQARAGVDDVQFDVDWIRRLRGVVALVWGGGAVIGILLVAAAAFTIANVVRLTILLHRDEIEVLRLVGAPEFLIRGPFLLGGMAQGFIGGLVALGLLRGVFEGVLRWVAATQNVLVGVFVVRFLAPGSSALLVLGGLLAGLLGGAVAVRRKNL